MEIEYDRIMRVENDAREIYHLKAIPFFDKGDWVIGGEEGLGHKGVHFCDYDAEVPKVPIAVGDYKTAVGHTDLALLERDSCEHEGELWGKEEICTAGVHSYDGQKI